MYLIGFGRRSHATTDSIFTPLRRKFLEMFPFFTTELGPRSRPAFIQTFRLANVHSNQALSSAHRIA